MLKHKAKSLRYRLRTYLAHYFLPKKKGIRVVIFAQGRTGSTLLESLICSTKHFKKGGELLGADGTHVGYPFQYVSGLSKVAKKKNFIFHLKIYHLLRDRKVPIDPGMFLRRLQADGWEIIFLRRTNKLNHVLSNMIREERGMAQKYDDTPEDFRLEVDPEQLAHLIEDRYRFEAKEFEALAGLRYTEVVYEDDLEDAANHQRTTDRIMDYLKLAKRPVSTRLKKVNRLTTRERVENYDEVVAMLEAKNWLGFLDK